MSVVWGENCNVFLAENDSSAIIVKHINYSIPWRDGTIVLIVTSTRLLYRSQQHLIGKSCMNELGFVTKILQKALTEIILQKKRHHVVHHVFKIIETITVSIFLHFPSLSVGKACTCDVSALCDRHKNGSGETYRPEVNHFV